jgi:hypothetical protein
MKKAALVVFAAHAALSFTAVADEAVPAKRTILQATPPATVAAKPGPVAVSKAVKLSDAELDKVTAGVTTIIFNPGHANVLIFHRNGLTCINCI